MLRRQRESDAEATRRGYRYGQIGAASLVSLAHGTNDAQKTMGVIALALVAHGTLTQTGDDVSIPLWVRLTETTRKQ
jgi:PiT family inorganic phosphate transporter